MDSKKKIHSSSRLPSLYGQTLIKAEFDYRREIRRKLDQLQHDNRDTVRRRLASDHVFAKGLLAKRHHWVNVDKSYRDACRISWNRDYAASGRKSHLKLPNIYPSGTSSPLSIASLTTLSSQDKFENPAVTNERIKTNFLYIQPVMLEILAAPHSSKLLKHKREVEIRKKSAQKLQVYIQTTARSDNRYTELVDSLQQV